MNKKNIKNPDILNILCFDEQQNNYKSLFNGDDIYRIPLYQRDYAWEEKEIRQLIEDILDIKETEDPYYLGSLIVSKADNNRECHNYEVIDGQQRLTTLYLLLNCLAKKYDKDILIEKDSLRFDCREKSNDTLSNIKLLIDLLSNNNKAKQNKEEIEKHEFENGIKIGTEVLLQLLSETIIQSGESEETKTDVDSFIKKLSKIKIFRIEVPPHTDLNKYFEIMNTRGEQLEQHDILKEQLMRSLGTKHEQTAFARIWEACSDMTGYVQMHFNTSDRSKLFGDWWNSLTEDRFDAFFNPLEDDDKDNAGADSPVYIISDIVNPDFPIEKSDGNIIEDDVEIRVRFESIVEFPYFLLHSLKVFLDSNCDESTVIPEMLDDKKLVKTFKEVVKNGLYSNGSKISEDKANFSRKFVFCLLKTRWLFDKYIIKREYKNESEEGDWSLEELAVSNSGGKKPYYNNTNFKAKKREQYTTNNKRIKENIMIQSALRVSYTSPKSMHWITHLLKWLMKNEFKPEDYWKEAELVAKNAVIDNFFNNEKCTDGKYELGVATPHIVFNYLDYLLWKKNNDKNFNFEFRNSVEHWYPRDPSDGTFPQWKESESCGSYDRFGNLCLVQRGINSKFSNLDPEAKKSTFKDTIAKGSLKLRRMSEKTVQKDEKTASQNWKDVECSVHEDEMITLLKEACESSLDS